MLTNADITIYHKRYNPETRLDEWQAAQSPGVNWYGRQSVTVGDSGLNTADSYIVRIPTTELIEVCNDDVVVKGLVNDVVASPSSLKAYRHFVVTSVSDNRRGTQSMQHWRIEGK